MKRIEKKRAARIWVLTAIQQCTVRPDKDSESEIRRFIRRIQRDIVSLDRALVEAKKSRTAEIAKLIKAQARDENDRKMRFDRAVEK